MLFGLIGIAVRSVVDAFIGGATTGMSNNPDKTYHGNSCYHCGHAYMKVFSGYNGKSWYALVTCDRCGSSSPCGYGRNEDDAKSNAVSIWNTMGE